MANLTDLLREVTKDGPLYCKEFVETGKCEKGPRCMALMHPDEAGAKQIDAGIGPNWEKLVLILRDKLKARSSDGVGLDMGKGKGKGKRKGKRKQS